MIVRDIVDGRRWAFVVCAALLAGCLLAPAANARLVVMHGYADVTSALIWIQADAPGPVVVSWRPAGEPTERRVELAASAGDDHIVVARLTGLAPGATASYRIEAGNEHREGTVRAQPWWKPAGAAENITIAIGSCFFLAAPDPRWPGQDYGGGFEVFDAIADRRPDLMLWLGDNLYFQRPDLLDPASMAQRHRRQRAFGPLQKLLTAAPQLAIWDDHDYGPNDSDASYVLKGETLKLFRRYWPNPSSGLPDVPGTFGFAQYGDVLFFLLDDRTHRSPNRWPAGADKTMFGTRQIEWLKQALTYAPRRALKIIAGGNQFWNRANRFEGWNHYASEQRAFADWLLARRIEGVVFLSGDRHFGELLRVERPGAYPLYEFTSSPLTSRPPSRIDHAERSNPDLVPGTLVARRQFGVIEITGTGDERSVTFASHDSSGALLWRHQLPLRELRFPRATTAAE
jgi:alkaline phosphatase D